MNFLTTIFGRPKSLSNILSTFEKTLDDLNDFIGDNAREIQENQDAITTLIEANTELRKENRRAANVFGNISSLLDQDEETQA